MTFVVNGYRLVELVEDPAAVEIALTRLANLLSAGETHMQHLGRQDLAGRFSQLSRQLHADGTAIDDTFDEAFRELTTEAADACETAAGPHGLESPDDPNTDLYQALSWSVTNLVIVRIGGHGTIDHTA
ncbi:hypothetical protein [Kribbella sp. NPDC049227]|uniref:hypothetical protein n=1 Tax=Kribbella sp. NPDC049227 TaxID=3364113 RepID=UPI0037125073